MTDEHLIQSIITAVIVTLFAVVLYLGLFSEIQKSTRAGGEAYTMQVCGQAHKISDGKSEKACGDAQDQYNLEFLCNARGADAACWVEEK